ncbi:MAG: hypothetical protein EWV85_21395 [Microcystis aeruginosa Ma_QC_C_20070703_M131]|uniref:Uncharacterized protein n=1 Tax=Microcystis aeruginosa Ma_QC_C_20070703_M131 TaxID=2486263 RepID=A0A551X592_MICAE|nr:MAG: hypothetical protein EWV85_21395 [Microcystis aeruginosa Ma_QC_C_20070703_M131]
MFKKTSQFSRKGKPNTQHLNPSESFCWVALGVLLGFLTSTQRTIIAMITIGFKKVSWEHLTFVISRNA